MNESGNITKTILFFDGNCGLCNRSIKFVLRKEKNHELFFSPLQSEFAKEIFREKNINHNFNTMMLLENGKVYNKSSASLRTTKYLKGLWPLMQGFLIVPPFIRNFFYNILSKNRIAWFGISNYCDMMTPELKKRFIE